MRVLIIGFGRFPGAPFNPSADLAKALAYRRRPAFAEVVRTAHIFATSYAAVDRDLPTLFADKPDILLMFGLAGRRHHVCVETRARNAVSVLFPDVGGHRPQSSVIQPGGPATLRAAAPTAAVLGSLGLGSIPSRLSRDAGRYLCNYAYWHALERVRAGRPLVQFIHIPPVRPDRRPRRQHGYPRATLSLLRAAAERALIALIAASRR
jgi:pyroglutamyl-peptidase